MTESYKNFLQNEIKKADDAWKKAMADGKYEEAAYIHGKRAAELEAILLYHMTH